MEWKMERICNIVDSFLNKIKANKPKVQNTTKNMFIEWTCF